MLREQKIKIVRPNITAALIRISEQDKILNPTAVWYVGLYFGRLSIVDLMHLIIKGCSLLRIVIWINNFNFIQRCHIFDVL